MKFILFFLALFLVTTSHSWTENRFWDTQKTGANVFSKRPRLQRFKDAQRIGIQFLRITPSKWKSLREGAKRGDFLIGAKGNYKGIIRKDLEYLISVLDQAKKAKIKIILTMLSLPGARWSQHNCNGGQCRQERELWENFKYHTQAADVWRHLAKALKDHPAVAAYNILNEPSPEHVLPKLRDWYTGDYQKWSNKVKGTPADLNQFYKTVIKAIRKEDRNTPIVIDTGFYATPYGLSVIDPEILQDHNLLYSFHSYVPYKLITNQGSYQFPGKIPVGELDSPSDRDAQTPYAPILHWEKKTFAEFYKPVTQWIAKNKINPNKVIVGEFGIYRQVRGAEEFLKQSIKFFNQMKWHWAFYAFREDDGHHAMDLELGTGALSPLYWSCMKNYTCQAKGIYTKNSLWEAVRSQLLGKP